MINNVVGDETTTICACSVERLATDQKVGGSNPLTHVIVCIGVR